MAILINVLLGLSLGSFFHVIIMRIKNGEKLFAGRSKCNSCGYQLAWYDLIPILSYCILRGKCRKCKTRISPSHIYAEIIFAAGFGMVGWLIPSSSVLQIFMAYIAVISMGIASISDSAEGEIYSPFVDTASAFAILLNLYVQIEAQQYREATIYTIVCGIAIGISVLFAFIDKERHMGYGDYHILLLLFLCAGMKGMLESVFFGSTVGIVMYVVNRNKAREIPFVPLLYYGYLIMLII